MTTQPNQTSPAGQARRDAWIFAAMAVAAAVLASALTGLIHGEPHQSDPLAIFAVVMACSAACCFTSAALKFRQAFRGGLRTIGIVAGLIASAALGGFELLVLLVLAAQRLFASISMQAGLVCVPLAAILALLLLWPFIWKFKLRRALWVLLPLLGLPLFVVLAVLYEFNAWDDLYNQEPPILLHQAEPSRFWSGVVPKAAWPQIEDLAGELVPQKADAALAWLARHQEPDGGWDARKHGATGQTDLAVSSLALLAFLGAGHTEKVGEYEAVVKRSLHWLNCRQQVNGDFIPDSADPEFGPSAAIATLALAEAAGMANRPDTRDRAQRAVNAAIAHRLASGGWGRTGADAGSLNATVWYALALKSAKVAGLNVPDAVLSEANEFIRRLEIPDTPGPGISQFRASVAAPQNPADAATLSALGNLGRQFLGWHKRDLKPSVEHFVETGGVPVWGADADLLYWYTGTLCVFQQGDTLWKRWNKAMKPALTANQIRQGDEMGSWPTTVKYGAELGRVGTTAVNAMCLEVYYRYQQLNP